jgi:serine protease Do
MDPFPSPDANQHLDDRPPRQETLPPGAAEPARAAQPPASTPAAPPPAARGARPAWRSQVALVLGASLLSATLAATATSALDGDAASVAATATSTAAAAGITTAVAGTTAGSVASAAAAVSPAVVTITTTSSVMQGGPFGGGTASGAGSGVIVSSDGLILTNAHVVEDADRLTVTLADGRSFDGTVVASDAALDLAVVGVEATGLPAADLGSSADLVVGQTVIAIGDPLGSYAGTVTTGIISAIDRDVTVSDDWSRTTHDLAGLLQTDAAINPGNSGGPLVALSGNVVGIVTAGSTSSEGIGFAIPIDDAAAILAQARGSVQQG